MTSGPTWPSDSSFADQAFAVAVEAFARTPERWEQGVNAAIASLFDFLADRSTQTTACVAGDLGTGPAALVHRDSVIERFAELLRPGFAPGAPPPIVAEAIGGGIYALVRTHVLERRLEELPLAAPHATVVALSPFMGASAALDLANSTNVQESG